MGAAEACNSVCIHVVAEKIRDIEEAKNVLVVLSESCANQTRISSGTVTPDTNRENGEENHEHDHDMSSPLTVTSCALSAPWFDGNLSETPTEAFLDSGADKSMLDYSHHSKYWEDPRIHAMRRLNFSCPTYNNSVRDDASYVLNLGGEISDEEYLFEIVYGFILEAVVSEQHIAELLLDSPRTPISAPRLSWIAETCPGAPVKSKRKCRNNIDNQVCTKLEF